MSNIYLNGVDQTSGQLRPTADADTTVVIGNISCPNTGTNSERFGRLAVASGNNSLAGGNGATAAAIGSTAIGYQSSVTSGATNATSLGFQANIAAPCLHSVAVGDNAYLTTSQRSIAIGWGAGDNSIASAADNIAIGDGAFIGGKNDNICIGDFGQAGGSATDTNNISIGNSNIIYGNRCVGIGFGTSITSGTPVDTILIGFGSADWGGTLSQSNVFISGSSSHSITDVWFGSGMNSGGAAPTTWNLRGSENWGSVSNKNGGRLNIAAGRGFNGGTGGDLYLQTSNVAPTNGTSNPTSIGATQDVGVFDHLGNARVGLNTTTEASTNGFIYIPAGTTTGPPSGTPSAFGGMVPIWFDTTNNLLWIYNGSWKSATFA